MQLHDLQCLQQQAVRLRQCALRQLLEEAARFEQFSYRAGTLLLDLTKQKLDLEALSTLGNILQMCDWTTKREAMFRGDVVNLSEQRPALHTALRACESKLPSLAPSHVLQEVNTTLARMELLVNAILSSNTASLGIPAGITDIVNIGIGGSDLGPRLAVEALAEFHTGQLCCHFLANVDGHETHRLMQQLDPRHTLVLLVSKSFTTQETLLNGSVLRDWIADSYAGDNAKAAAHFIAVSANVDAARAFGISVERILPMWDFVGGRYSVWSAVGLSLALMIGMPRFREFLSGAAQLDDHFRSAAWNCNLPVLLALTGIWNRNALNYPSLAVIPYHDRLRELPAYLQQLEMESLGKSVSAEGQSVRHATVPVLWGNVGSNVQHAFFQALHQGTDIVPVDFIGVIKPAHSLQQNHQALLANLLAQSAALAMGKTADEALAETRDGDTRLAAQRTFSGDRPSTTILLDALTPQSLGMLLALYEHKVFVQSVMWEINPFDQWGVELGKIIAKKIFPTLSGNNDISAFDASTQGLIATIRHVLSAK